MVLHSQHLDAKLLLFPKWQILDSSKLKEFPDDNFKFDANGINFAKQVENTTEKRSCSRHVLKTHKTQDLFGKELNHSHTMTPFDKSE